MFLKKEKPEMDEFERKKTLVIKEKYDWKILWKSSQVSQYIFGYSFVSEHSRHFFLTKNLHFLMAGPFRGGG